MGIQGIVTQEEISSTVGIVNFTPTERKHLCEFDITKIYEFGIACRKIKCSIICYIFLIKNIVHIGLNHLLYSLEKKEFTKNFTTLFVIERKKLHSSRNNILLNT